MVYGGVWWCVFSQRYHNAIHQRERVNGAGPLRCLQETWRIFRNQIFFSELIHVPTVMVYTNLSAKEPHKPVGLDSVMTSGSLGGVTVNTLSRNAVNVGAIPTLRCNISHIQSSIDIMPGVMYC